MKVLVPCLACSQETSIDGSASNCVTCLRANCATLMNSLIVARLDTTRLNRLQELLGDANDENRTAVAICWDERDDVVVFAEGSPEVAGAGANLREAIDDSLVTEEPDPAHTQGVIR